MTPNLTLATAVLEEARAAAARATAAVAEVRERLSVHECSDADLRRALRAETKAKDAVETAKAGLRVAQRVAQAEEAEEAHILERVRYEQHRQALITYGKTCTRAEKVIKQALADLADIGEAYDAIRPVIGQGGAPWPDSRSEWAFAVRGLSGVLDALPFEAARFALPAYGLTAEEMQ